MLTGVSGHSDQYGYATHQKGGLWHVRVVSTFWVSYCLESLYHPARSLEEQVEAALDQEATKVQLGKAVFKK